MGSCRILHEAGAGGGSAAAADRVAGGGGFVHAPPDTSKADSDVSQFSVLYGYVLFGAPDQGQMLDVYRSDF